MPYGNESRCDKSQKATEVGVVRPNTMRLMLTVFALSLASCGNDPEAPRTEEKTKSQAEILPRSAEERAFDERLAAIHRDWMGTPWTFSGTSRSPRQGSIACGYFVTTTLEQAGVAVDRVRLAQAASEKMILETTERASVRRYSDASLEDFLAGVRSQGEGYYIVGLDHHTGFLKVERDGVIAFIHSGPGRGVVEESPADAPELANSRYRVTGKIVATASAEPAATGSPASSP